MAPGNLLSAIALLSFATGGAQVIGNMGSEIIDPQKNMPKVIIISTVTVGIMYALVAMVASAFCLWKWFPIRTSRWLPLM